MNTSRCLPVLFLLTAALASPALLGAEVLNRIVLRVNDQVATLYDYQQRRANVTEELLRQPNLDAEQRRSLLAEASELAFKDLYEELLIESRAAQLGITVSKEQVDQHVAQMRESFGIETDEQFVAALAQSGMTEEQLRERIRRDMRAREVMGREVQSRINLEEEDLRRFYHANREEFRLPEQVQVREVVVLEEGGLPTAEERARVAEQIRQAVAGGSTLADAVAEHSQRGHVSSVIDLGWVTPGDLDPALEAAAWKLQPGQLSEPVPGRGGLHVLQVVERRESRIVPFAEVQEQIRQREQRREMQDKIGEYMAELEKKSLIVAEPPPEAAGFRRFLGARPQSEAERLGLAAPAAPSLEEMPAAPMRDPASGEPGALPEPKPPTNTAPPVIEEPPTSSAPPPVR